MIISKKQRFLLRFMLVFSIQLMIKGFDYSFGRFFDITLRGLIFSGYYITFWMLIWYLAGFLNKKLGDINTLIKILTNLAFSFCLGFATSISYRLGDSYIFNNPENWTDIPVVNPELTISMMLIYMLIYSANEFLSNNLKIKEEQIKSEQLEKENAIAQYKSLKAQIEPHFLFNSLSILSSIIHSDTNLASEFLDKLSKTLRYIIEMNERTLVSVNEELHMVNDYFFLLKTRFSDSIILKKDVPEEPEEYYLPPAVIQILIENAVKHNKFNSSKPLNIEILQLNNHIIVSNNINPKEQIDPSTGTGLNNIKSRYQLLCQEEVVIENKDLIFSVSIPLISSEQYENINH